MYIFFSFSLHSIHAQMGQRARARGPKRKRWRGEEREREIGGGSRNEIEVGSKGEVGSLPTKERERESEKGLGMSGNGERETRKRDEELPAEGVDEEVEVTAERGADLTLLVHLDRRL